MKKIALVGCGRILARHVEAIGTAPGLEIALVCDVDEPKARKAAERIRALCHGLSRHSGVDVAAVLTPSGNHPLHAAEIA